MNHAEKLLPFAQIAISTLIVQNLQSDGNFSVAWILKIAFYDQKSNLIKH